MDPLYLFCLLMWPRHILNQTSYSWKINFNYFGFLNVSSNQPVCLIFFNTMSHVTKTAFTRSRQDITPCNDFRGLNDITVTNKYPLPLINSAFEPLQGATVFSPRLDPAGRRVENSVQHPTGPFQVSSHAFWAHQRPSCFSSHGQWHSEGFF